MHVATAASVLLGVVMLVAAVSKVSSMPRWRAQSADLGVPRALVPVVPALELVLAALCVAQLQRRVAAWCGVTLLLVFSAVIAVQLARGRRPACACFGSSRPISGWSLVRNALFVAVGLVAALG